MGVRAHLAPSLLPLGNGFTALGDSISCAGTAASAGGGFGQNWVPMVAALSQGRFNYLGNGAVSGENSTQVLARVPNIIALKPQIVAVMAGTNDISQSVAIGTWQANIKAIASQLRTAGIRVVLCTLPPRDNTQTTQTATTLIWNRWLRIWAQQNRYELVDFYKLLADGTTGFWASGYGADSVHPNATGHLAMANHFISAISVPAFTPIQALTSTDANNLALNPLLTSGSPTPTNWTPSGTGGMTGVTEGLVTDSDFIGKAWEWQFVTPSVGFRSFHSGLISNTNFSVGDTVLFTCKFKVTVSSGVPMSNDYGIAFKPFFNSGSPNLLDLIPGVSQVQSVGLAWYTVTVPTGTASIQTGWVLNNIPGAASYTARVGQFGVFNLTRLGLAPTA